MGRPIPVFVFDPRFYESEALVCDSRIEFLFESLETLKTRYQERGGDLLLLVGNPIDRLTTVFDGPIYYNRTTTAGEMRDRERTIATQDQFHGFDADAIRRDTATPRDSWQEHAEAYFEHNPIEPPDAIDTPPREDELSIVAARDRWEVTPTKRDVPPGGRDAAVQRLETFLDDINQYPQSISPPAAAREGCSRLSPYLAKGIISPREVYQQTLATTEPSRARELFTTRLFWNQHFTQKLQDFPRLHDQAVNPVFRGLHRDEHDPAAVRAWKDGQTGFPLVDASMRALRETGYLNFRMRALTATFFVHILREWWKRGADHFYRHLIDAEPGINYAQWQMQGGLVGVHPLRIYDPAKNTREHDPDGEFIREFMPELQAVPDEYLAQPERMSKAMQAETGVELGQAYPRPIVDFDTRREQTRREYARLADRAQEALSDPAIRKRASLSRRHESIKEDTTTQGQMSLTDFG